MRTVWRVPKDDAIRLAAPQDIRGRAIHWMAQRALTLDQDNIWAISLRGPSSRNFKLATTELKRHRVYCHGVFCALHQNRLTRANKNRLDAICVQRACQNCCCCLLSDGATCAENRNSQCVESRNVTFKLLHAFTRFGPSYCSDAALANSTSSLGFLYMLLTTFKPSSIAFRTTPRSVGESPSVDGAIP
jgi:hypothetical protein